MTALDEFLTDILKKEGGYVNDPKDSGGETNYGITIAVARKYGYKGDMKSMPIKIAKDIYKDMYWDSLMLDEIAPVSSSVALKLGDIAVNMGVARAGQFMQRSLNVLNLNGSLYADLIVDGKVGIKTINAFRTYMKRRKGDGELVFFRALNCLQGNFYFELAERREKDEKFVFGWFLNRVA